MLDTVRWEFSSPIHVNGGVQLIGMSAIQYGTRNLKNATQKISSPIYVIGSQANWDGDHLLEFLFDSQWWSTTYLLLGATNLLQKIRPLIISKSAPSNNSIIIFYCHHEWYHNHQRWQRNWQYISGRTSAGKSARFSGQGKRYSSDPTPRPISRITRPTGPASTTWHTSRNLWTKAPINSGCNGIVMISSRAWLTH